MEDEIATHVLHMAKVFYGISPIEFRRLAFEFAEKNGIQHPFNRTTKMAGTDWLHGFMKRHPTISLRKPEATSLSRIEGFNKDEVNLFFQNLETVFGKHNYPASRIYNCDETGITTVQKPGKILGPKGQKQIGAAVSWERGKNVTVNCAFSASGNYIPPLFIFPRKRLSPLLCKDGPMDSIYKCSDNGWIKESIFFSWLEHFKNHTKPTAEDPVLLVMDNHCSHKSLRIYEFCREHHITVVTIPPHTSHRLQPLDVSFYSALKSAFNRECDLFMKTRGYIKITPYDLASLFNKAYQRTATIEKAVSGFRSTGIFPLDPDKFTEDDFVPSLHQATTLPTIDMDETENLDGQENQEPTEEKKNDTKNVNLNFEPRPSTSRDNNEKTCEDSIKLDRVTKKLFSDLTPLPRKVDTKQTKRRKQHSEIMTSTPMKSIFEENNKKKMENEEKKLKMAKKKQQIKQNRQRKLTKPKKSGRKNITFESSSDESGHEIELDDDEMDDMEPAINIPRGQSGINDICLICNGPGKDNELWYRCTKCSKWAHAECSGWDSAENYTCDYCQQ